MPENARNQYMGDNLSTSIATNVIKQKLYLCQVKIKLLWNFQVFNCYVDLNQALKSWNPHPLWCKWFETAPSVHFCQGWLGRCSVSFGKHLGNQTSGHIMSVAGRETSMLIGGLFMFVWVWCVCGTFLCIVSLFLVQFLRCAILKVA